MEILAEIVFAIFGGLIEFVFGVVFQIVAEIFRLLFGRNILPSASARSRAWTSGAVYLAGGAAAGALSLWIAPELWLKAGWQRWANFFLMPLVAGVLTQLWDAWRQRFDTPGPALDGFYRGVLFAAAMTGVRLVWGR